VLVYLFIMYIKDLFKFLLVRNVAIIISFGYPSYNIITFLFINACLTRDLFRELEADF
jgi:hypothetical protein